MEHRHLQQREIQLHHVYLSIIIIACINIYYNHQGKPINMEKRPRECNDNAILAESPSQKQKLNPSPPPLTKNEEKITNIEEKGEIKSLDSANIDLLKTFMSPTTGNNNQRDLVLRTSSSQGTISRSTSRNSSGDSGEEAAAATTSETTTKTTLINNQKTLINTNTAISIDKNTTNNSPKSKKNLSPRPPSLKINIGSSSTSSFERPSALLPAIKTPVSVKSEQATQLHRAVLSGSITDVDTILKATGFSLINKKDDNGYTALMSAAALADSKIGLEICKLLLNENADVALSDHEGFTAFHWASAVGNDMICMHLATSTTIDVNAQSHNGDTALHRACRLGMERTIKTIVEKCGPNINVNIKNKRYLTPFGASGVFENGRKHTLYRKRARRALATCKGCEHLKSLILHHDDCNQHVTPDGHYEGTERIPAILKHLKDDKTMKSPLCLITSDFPKLKKEFLLYAHSKTYVDVVYNLHETVTSTGKAMPFTPRVKEGVQHVPSKKSWSDTSFSPGSLSAALYAAGGAVHAVEKVMNGERRNAFVLTRPPGHHAGLNGLEEESKSCGFCIFNNVAIAALYAIKHKLAKRVAIIDFDVHHGQGTEEIIEHINQPENLLFVSSHLFQKTKGYEFYPGTGKEMGKLEENIINVPLAPLWTKGSNTPTSSGGLSSTRSGKAKANVSNERKSNNNHNKNEKLSPRIPTLGVSCCCGMGRQCWKNQIENRVLPAVRAFNPDLILLSAGFDAGKHDVGNMNLLDELKPRVGMDLSVEDYTWLTDKINNVANLCCDGRVVSVLEGGYGRWTRRRNGNTTEFVIDRTLLADNCTAHIRAMVGNYFDD